MENEAELLAEIRQLKASQRRLKFLCCGVSALVVSGLLMGAATLRNEKFDVIDAQRINIREPDGTIRMTISNRAQFPGAFIRNKEIAHPRPMAGMLFINDEGTENGGLVFNGAKNQDGKPSSGLSLTFDRYQQDQQMQLLGVDEEGKHYAALSFNDVADGLTRPVFSDRDNQLNNKGEGAITQRVYLGKTQGQNSMLSLLDGKGRPRIELKVTQAGQASMVFLDENGRAVKTIAAEDIK
ncbi:hypothetical protein [Niveibacterium terrae]|uniref:hypothetical protein n=1 Tax=Niveibacterium terrae TaxID=3373598 RepID=UPI003A9339F0